MNNRDNRDVRDHEPRERTERTEYHTTRDYDKKDKFDTSWILPALIGLGLLGTLGYFLLRRPGLMDKVTTPETTTLERTTTEPVKTAVHEVEKATTTTTDEKPKA